MNILICDDEPLFAVSLRRLIKCRGVRARVILACEGEGPGLARRMGGVEVIVLDLFQPSPGLDQLAAFRAQPETAHTPIVLVSAVPIPDAEAWCQAIGASAVFTKPLPDDFVDQLLSLSARVYDSQSEYEGHSS